MRVWVHKAISEPAGGWQSKAQEGLELTAVRVCILYLEGRTLPLL